MGAGGLSIPASPAGDAGAFLCGETYLRLNRLRGSIRHRAWLLEPNSEIAIDLRK
jgi:hypothetical protein